MSKTQTAPIWVWVLSLSAFAAIMIPSAWFFVPLWESSFEELSRERLEAFSQKNDKPKVLAIGSSLLRCATVYDHEMEEKIKEEVGEDIYFLRLTRSASSFEYTESLLEDFLQSGAQIILFEARSLFYELPQSSDSIPHHALMSHRYYLKQLILHGLSCKDAAKKRYDGEQTRDRQAKNHSQQRLQEHCFIADQFRMMETIPENLQYFLKEAQSKNIRIVILDIPRSKELNEHLYTENQKFRSMLTELQKEYALDLWSYPETPNLDELFDWAHYGPEPRKRFCTWLSQQISKDLEGTHEPRFS
ncbi:MAG: hypothetical protein CMO81_06195 [Waddliaceae bacterium]|nr:hypothetical protein [Waddliaceae bacterium]